MKLILICLTFIFSINASDWLLNRELTKYEELKGCQAAALIEFLNRDLRSYEDRVNDPILRLLYSNNDRYTNNQIREIIIKIRRLKKIMKRDPTTDRHRWKSDFLFEELDEKEVIFNGCQAVAMLETYQDDLPEILNSEDPRKEHTKNVIRELQEIAKSDPTTGRYRWNSKFLR